MGNLFCQTVNENQISIYGNYLDSDTRSLLAILECADLPHKFVLAYQKKGE